jgi:hypothetical protein
MDINIELAEKYLKIKMNTNKSFKQKKTSICLKDFFCLNNIKICEKIKEKYNLSGKYHIINDYSSITFGEVSEKIYNYDTNNTKNTNNNNKYVLLEYNNINYLDFDDFIFKLLNPKLFIFHVLDSYSFLLNSLLNLEEIGICFFNLSTKNIFFCENYKPMLRNFETSLLLDKCTDIDYLSKIIEKVEDYTYKPLEIHVIFYLIKNNETSLSFSAIDSICNNFISNMTILSLFSKQYKENYYKLSMECLKKYINKPTKEIISEILKYSNTWDNYELSILYLYIFGNITRVFSLKDTLITKITSVLSKNIGPDPIKRESLKGSIEILDNLYNEFTDWEYVNSISKEKMSKLYEILFK